MPTETVTANVQLPSTPIQLEIRSDTTSSSRKFDVKDLISPLLVGLLSIAGSWAVQCNSAESQALLGQRSEALAKQLDENRRQFEAEFARLQGADAEAQELLSYRRTQRAELLLPLFKNLPAKDSDQTPERTSAKMTDAYLQGAGLFLGKAAPVYHWAQDMLHELAMAQGSADQLHRAAHRVVSTLRTALIAEVEGNDDERWKANAARTLQRESAAGVPSFGDMRKWKDGQKLLAYLVRADDSMGQPDTDGSWPSEE